MHRPPTTFDTPQMRLVPDARGYRQYANVDNRVQFLPHGRDVPKLIPTEVPTGLFTLMRDVFKVEPQDDVVMYIHEYAPAQYVFGIQWGDGEYDLADLWTYSESSLPGMFRR